MITPAQWIELWLHPIEVWVNAWSQDWAGVNATLPGDRVHGTEEAYRKGCRCVSCEAWKKARS